MLLSPSKIQSKAPLREIVQPIQRGEAPLPGTAYRQIGVRLWGEGAYERETIDGSQTQYSQLFKVETGDIIVNKIWARNGSVAVVADRLAGCFGSNEFPTFTIDQTKMEPRWFHWFTKTPDLWRQCDLLSRGTSGKNRLRPEKFLGVEIPLPILPEQQRIVTQLDAVANKLEAYRVEAKAHEQELQALLNKAFWQIAKDAPYRPMAKVAPLVRRAVEIEPETEYTELGVKSFYKGVFQRRTLLGAEYSWQKLFWVKHGDIIFSNIMAWEQAIAVAMAEHDDCVGNHRMLTCEANHQLATPEYIWFYFTTQAGFSQILEASPGTIARNKTLSADQLMSIQVPCPNVLKQKAFSELLFKARDARQLRADIEADLTCLLPALLHRAFGTGEG